MSAKSLLIAACALLTAPLAAQAQTVADRIWHGGPILTLNDVAVRAEAVAEKDGRILAVGDAADILALRGEGTTLIDLGGRTLLPGFVDSHGHVVMGGLQALSANLLAPPDGGVTGIAGMQAALRDWMAANEQAVSAVNLILGFGYDPAQMAEKRHPTREDLDAVSTEIPVYVVHQSGHFGAANSVALDRAGITAETPDPPGGIIRRGPDGTPDGVLEETAHFEALVALLGDLDANQFETFALAGAELWARFGYTTAQEGRSLPATVAVMRRVAEAGGFPIDVVTYPDVLVDRDFIARTASRDYIDRLRVGGAKLTIDGSPQGFSAWRDRPYYDPVGDYPPAYAGYQAATNEEVLDAIDWAYANGIQIITHANGEAASDLLLAGIEAAQETYGLLPLRPVLIHGQLLREDQVDSLNRLHVFPSLFPMHTFYWGDWHRDHTVGPALADNISPTGWVHKRGMRFGTHHDAPVAFPDSMRVLDATVNRRTRSGDILGPDQRVDVLTALKAMTIWPAWQHFEEDDKGSIEVGKLADFVILSDDPTAVDPESLAAIEVEETIKEGETVFVLDAAAIRRGRLMIGPGSEAERSFARTLRGLAATTELAALPEQRQTPFARFGLYASVHGGACVVAAMNAIVAQARVDE